MDTDNDVNQLQCAADLFEFDEDKKVTFKEFFAKYKDQFPMLAVVIGGLYGDTHFDTFDHLQVMRIHCYSSQSRVVCIDDKEASSLKYHYLTIPLSIGVNFRVIRSHTRVGGPQTLKEILEENTLPVLVKMACGDEYPVKRGLSSCRAGNFGNLLIKEQYLEHYFMINCIDTVDLKMNPIVCLGALSDELEATPVEGFKYDTKENYEKFLKKLADQVANSGEKYDKTRGDPAIEEYCAEDVDVETGRGGIPTYNAPRIDLTTIYPDMNKKKPEAPQRRPSDKDALSDSDDEYEQIDDRPPIPKRVPKCAESAEIHVPDAKSKKQTKPNKNIMKAIPKKFGKGKKMFGTMLSRMKSKDEPDDSEDSLEIGNPVLVQNFKHRHPQAKAIVRPMMALKPAENQLPADESDYIYNKDDQEIYDVATDTGTTDCHQSASKFVNTNTVKDITEDDEDDEYTYIDENQIGSMKRVDPTSKKDTTENKRKNEVNKINKPDSKSNRQGNSVKASITDSRLDEKDEDAEYEYIDESTLASEIKHDKKRPKPEIKYPKPTPVKRKDKTNCEKDQEKTSDQRLPSQTKPKQQLERADDEHCAHYGKIIPPDKTASQDTEDQTSDNSATNAATSYVENMTIKEVGDALCKLRLQKYVDKFASNQIDGKVLALLDMKDLVTELKMLKLEAIRLTAFKKDGHIPT